MGKKIIDKEKKEKHQHGWADCTFIVTEKELKQLKNGKVLFLDMDEYTASVEFIKE